MDEDEWGNWMRILRGIVWCYCHPIFSLFIRNVQEPRALNQPLFVQILILYHIQQFTPREKRGARLGKKIVFLKKSNRINGSILIQFGFNFLKN